MRVSFPRGQTVTDVEHEGAAAMVHFLDGSVRRVSADGTPPARGVAAPVSSLRERDAELRVDLAGGQHARILNQ